MGAQEHRQPLPLTANLTTLAPWDPLVAPGGATLLHFPPPSTPSHQKAPTSFLPPNPRLWATAPNAGAQPTGRRDAGYARQACLEFVRAEIPTSGGKCCRTGCVVCPRGLQHGNRWSPRAGRPEFKDHKLRQPSGQPRPLPNPNNGASSDADTHSNPNADVPVDRTPPA